MYIITVTSSHGTDSDWTSRAVETFFIHFLIFIIQIRHTDLQTPTTTKRHRILLSSTWQNLYNLTPHEDILFILCFFLVRRPPRSRQLGNQSSVVIGRAITSRTFHLSGQRVRLIFHFCNYQSMGSSIRSCHTSASAVCTRSCVINATLPYTFAGVSRRQILASLLILSFSCQSL